MGEGKPFTVAGIGPGESAYRIPAADKAVQEADLLIGAERHLSLFKHLEKETFSLTGIIPSLPMIIRERWLSQKITLLVSGDPGFHSLLGLISRNFAPHEYRVIPGIGSLQLAAARTGEPWQDDLLLSLHGRDPAAWTETVKEALDSGRRVFFLTDRANCPQKIGKRLISQRLSHCKIKIFYRLGYEDEQEVSMRLSELVAKPEYRLIRETLCVMIIYPF